MPDDEALKDSLSKTVLRVMYSSAHPDDIRRDVNAAYASHAVKVLEHLKGRPLSDDDVHYLLDPAVVSDADAVALRHLADHHDQGSLARAVLSSDTSALSPNTLTWLRLVAS